MENVQFSEGAFFEWWDAYGMSHWKRREGPRREHGAAVRETPEEMVRALQGIFCKGRYRSMDKN